MSIQTSIVPTIFEEMTNEGLSDNEIYSYITEGIGISFTAEKSVQMEAGLGLKQTIVMQENLASHYGLNNGETLRFEGGLTTGMS